MTKRNKAQLCKWVRNAWVYKITICPITKPNKKGESVCESKSICAGISSVRSFIHINIKCSSRYICLTLFPCLCYECRRSPVGVFRGKLKHRGSIIISRMNIFQICMEDKACAAWLRIGIRGARRMRIWEHICVWSGRWIRLLVSRSNRRWGLWRVQIG